MGIAVGIAAAAMGAVQCILLNCIAQRITKLKKGSVFPFVIAKVLIYACIIVCVFTFLKKYVLYAGIGYPVGMLCTLLVLTIINFRKSGDENK